MKRLNSAKKEYKNVTDEAGVVKLAEEKLKEENICECCKQEMPSKKE